MNIDVKKAGVLLVALISIGGMNGCGSGGPQAVETASKDEVAKMAQLRSIYDSVGGDYSKLSEDQKKQFLDYSKGSQSQVDSMWNVMGKHKPVEGGPAPTPNSVEEARKRQMGHGGR
jgi:hypothetical protein